METIRAGNINVNNASFAKPINSAQTRYQLDCESGIE